MPPAPILRPFIAGHAAFGEALPAPVDAAGLRPDLERAGAEVLEHEPATWGRNHHRVRVRYRGRELLVLLNGFHRILALAEPDSEPAYAFKDSTPLFRALRVRWEVAERARLEATPAADGGTLSLGDEMEALVHRAARVGDIVFNHWE